MTKADEVMGALREIKIGDEVSFQGYGIEHHGRVVHVSYTGQAIQCWVTVHSVIFFVFGDQLRQR